MTQRAAVYDVLTWWWFAAATPATPSIPGTAQNEQDIAIALRLGL